MTYHWWRKEFGGLKSDQVKRLKELEAENARLRRAVADLTLDKLILIGGPRLRGTLSRKLTACFESYGAGRRLRLG